MSLTAGTRLGPYEIVAPLGAGGMGEVYRAHDTRLKRDVAIKVLPETLAHDKDRLARFQREAEFLAALNHPNIAAVHGLEECDGVTALVLELVDGLTLAEMLSTAVDPAAPNVSEARMAAGVGPRGQVRKAGALPLDDALSIARQIADALEAAHDRGVVHRDLKPANVKITPEGKVKVLDFGLAKALDVDPSSAAGQRSMSPTLSVHATQAGLILGTAAYMSPEQARGKPVDRRTDIWAFGCVLFEMLTGRQAFAADGDSVSDAIASVLKTEPEWSALPEDTPAHIRTLLRRCLQKDPQKRLPHIGLARIEMDEAPATAASLDVPATDRLAKPAGSIHRHWLRVAATAVVSAVIAGAAVWLLMRSAPVSRRVIRLQATPPGEPLLLDPFAPDVAISPDGSRIIYVAGASGQLYVRALDQPDALPLRGIQGVRGPFVSPDGEWVGYFQGPDLKKVSIRGGSAIVIARNCCSGNRGGTWAPDDTIIMTSANGGTGLLRVPAAGGVPSVLAAPDRAAGELSYRWPEMLPGGRGVLFTITSTRTSALDTTTIAVRDLKTGEQRPLVRGGSHARWAPSGHLVFGEGGTLRAVAFDVDRLAVLGNPTPVLDNIVTKSFGAADFSVSADGSLVYVAGSVVGAERTVVWIDRSGHEEPIEVPARNYVHLSLSPDGSQVALDARDQDDDIWIWEFARKTFRRLTFDPATDGSPLWMKDGRVLFASSRNGASNLYSQRSDNTGGVERLSESPTSQTPNSVSPDGKMLVFTGVDPKTTRQALFLMPLTGDRTSQPLVRSAFGVSQADISPDGRWLAYQATDSGVPNIYVSPFPGVDGGRWQISSASGIDPLWARNGRELFFQDGSGRLFSVAVQTSQTFSAGNPTVITERAYIPPVPGAHTYAVSADGRRFLRIKAAVSGDKNVPAQLMVVLNWGDELKRLVPTRK